MKRELTKEELDKTRLKEKLNKVIEEADELTLLMNEDYCTFYEKHAKRMYDLQKEIQLLRRLLKDITDGTYIYPLPLK